VAFATAAGAQQAASGAPNFVNAQVETRPLTGQLGTAISSLAAEESAPLWAGYEVAVIRPANGESRQMCCGNWSSGSGISNCACQLEDRAGDGGSISETKAPGGTLKLEGADTMFVLLRIADHRVEKVRAVTPECRVDAGGLRVVWFGVVKPEDSVAWLAPLVKSSDWADRQSRQPAADALMAIAIEDGAAADAALESFIAPTQPERLRSQTAFWLGSTRGKAGLALLTRLAKDDPSAKVREQVTFALSVSHEPGALEALIHMAHSDPASAVRGQALFWLGQKAGQRAAAEITGAIENDPDTEVKNKAVFALSQLPKDQGVPLLIQVARSNKNREVRKQAMFWLGQSNDPWALAFFEEVLEH
jgi:HEAT repeats